MRHISAQTAFTRCACQTTKMKLAASAPEERDEEGLGGITFTKKVRRLCACI